MSKYVGDFHRGTGFVCFDSFLIMKVLILLKFPFYALDGFKTSQDNFEADFDMQLKCD